MSIGSRLLVSVAVGVWLAGSVQAQLTRIDPVIGPGSSTRNGIYLTPGGQYTATGAMTARGVSGWYVYSSQNGVESLNSPGTAEDINASLQIAGTANNRAFRHDLSTATTYDLGVLPGGASTQGLAISSNGTVVGDAFVNSQEFAFAYYGTPGQGGFIRQLPTLGFNESIAYDINSSDIIVGSSLTAAHKQRMFRYNSATQGIEDLGALTSTSSSSIAYGINDSNVVVGSSTGANDVGEHAVMYVDGVGVTDLDQRAGNTFSRATAVNNNNVAVGVLRIAGTSTQHAFAYVGRPGIDQRMVDLDMWLDEINPTLGAAWTLTGADDITDAGLLIGTGTYDGPGTNNDGTRGFILDISPLLVPEPASLSLIVLGGWVLTARRKHRREPTLAHD